MPPVFEVSGDTAPAGFLSANTDYNPLITAVFMHMESEINGAAINFNQTYSLLDDIILQALTVS